MTKTMDNVAIAKQAFELWNETKGGSIEHWLSVTSEDVDLRSLAEGEIGMEFTKRRRSRAEVEAYFEGLLAGWEMIHYTVDEYVAEGDRVVAIGSTAWRNRKSGAEFDTPKVDLLRFRDGMITEFFELYDTAMVIKASQTS